MERLIKISASCKFFSTEEIVKESKCVTRLQEIKKKFMQLTETHKEVVVEEKNGRVQRFNRIVQGKPDYLKVTTTQMPTAKQPSLF